MGSDDIVIGSGLAALGAVLGLIREPGRTITVLCGPQERRFVHYERSPAPCAFFGPGGLGSFWHGVIPTGLRTPAAGHDRDAFTALFLRFYPHAKIDGRAGDSALFVPWRPIRPWTELQRIAASERDARVRLVPAPAVAVRRQDGRVQAATAVGAFDAARCWVAAGALGTPALLSRSFGTRLARGFASDHVVCYLGQLEEQPPPVIRHTRSGVYFPAVTDVSDRALYTTRPARFDFRRLDAGFERRQIFGAPAGMRPATLLSRMSPGLLAEILYNRLGVFGAARRHSVYAQLPVRDAYAIREGPSPLRPQPDRIRMAADAVRAAQPFAGLVASQRPELYLPGIHLHHTLDTVAMVEHGLDDPANPVQVLDASASADIGPAHHSFRMLVDAFTRVQIPPAGAAA